MKKLFYCSIMLFIGCSMANNVIPIHNFVSKQYLGTWYEVARLPNSYEKHCVLPITATYSAIANESKQFVVVNQCNNHNGDTESSVGAAYIIESENVGKLKVTFAPKLLRWLPFTHGDYWILGVDYDKVAVVGTPNHKYLWILSRTATLESTVLQQAISLAHEQGFATDQLIIHQPQPTRESI